MSRVHFDLEAFRNHLQRLKAGASQAVAIEEISRWIAENTYIGGKPYSYKDHEYQQRILDSKARETIIRKCSQVGISELSVRKSLALCGMISGYDGRPMLRAPRRRISRKTLSVAYEPAS